MNDVNKVYQKVSDLLMDNEKISNYKNPRKGFLYFILVELFQEAPDSSNEATAEQTNKVCNKLGIGRKSSLDKDYEKVINIIDFNDESSSEANDSMFKKLNKKFFKNLDPQSNAQGIVPIEEENKRKMEFIIFVVCCILVGFCVCLRYIERKEEEFSRRHPPQPQPTQQSSETRPIFFNLYLIVPASEAIRFYDQREIKVSDLKYLIDVSSYFFCEKAVNENNKKLSLDLSGEPIRENSYREVYVKVEIYNDKNILNAKTRYTLKENLENAYECKIEGMACLKSLSGLESFVRI